MLARFVEVNAAFEKHTGLENATGRWMREINPRQALVIEHAARVRS